MLTRRPARVAGEMANADQIKALIRSHAEGDDTRFYAIAMQMAALAAKKGQGKLAQELRGLIDDLRIRPASSLRKPVPVASPRGELAGLLSVGYPKTGFADIVLDSPVRKRIERVLLEQQQRNLIREHGLSPMRKLLLVGPPGTGKTMTASVLATELSLPLFSIQLDGLITKFLGETAAKLRLIFDAIPNTRGVYFFDELDALGAERVSKNDVGEIRRVLNSLLQFLESESSDSLIVGATNHSRLLDRALFRRFDAVIDYCLPSKEIAEEIMRSRLALLDTSAVEWKTASKASESLSHAEIVRACEQAAKDAILRGSLSIHTESLASALDERRAAHGDRT